MYKREHTMVNVPFSISELEIRTYEFSPSIAGVTLRKIN